MALLRKRGRGESVQEAHFSHAGMLPCDPALTEYQTGEKTKREDFSDFRARKKPGKKQKQQAVVKKSDSERQIAESFLQDILHSENLVQAERSRNSVRTCDLDIHGNQVYSVPEAIRALNITGGIPFLRSGLYLGEIKKDRFEPSQALAIALRSGDCAPAAILDFDCTDDRVRRYLCGETIEADDLLKSDCLQDQAEDCLSVSARTCAQKGWCLVCVNGFPLGWGRCVNGTLKNKYHPGWRMRQ